MSTDDDWNDDSYEDEYNEQDDNYYSRRESEPGPRKKKQGMSTGVKVLIVLLCVGGGFFVICCGFGLYMVGSVAKGFNADPEATRRMTQEIVEIDIPERFDPKQSIDLDIPFFSSIPKMRIVMYQASEQSVLIIAEIDVDMEKFGPGGEEAFRKEIEKHQGGQSLPQVDVDDQETEVRQYEIRGKQVDVTFSKGVSPETQQEMHQVMTVFPGNNGVVMIMLVAEKDDYDEKEIDQMFKSIK